MSITELVCENHDELKYYNSRSTHNIPLSKSIKLFENWEEDELAYKRRPYMTDEKALQNLHVLFKLMTMMNQKNQNTQNQITTLMIQILLLLIMILLTIHKVEK